MKAALVSEHASPLALLGGADAGGQNVHVAGLAAALAKRGVDVTVYTRRDDAELPQRVQLAGYTVEHVDAGPATPLPKDELLPHMPAFGEGLAAAFASKPPDVVHAHFWMSGLASLDAAGDIPVVQTFHALGSVKRRLQELSDTSPPQRIEHERKLGWRCARVVASSRDERNELIRLGAPESHIDVVPSGIDPERFSPVGPGVPRSGRPRVGAVSRLVPRKGIDDAIRAVASLPGVELLIAGGPGKAFDDDPEVNRLRGIIEEEHVSDRVFLLGPVPQQDLARLLRSCDAVACLPWYEPFGLVPLEAMSCGVPVIAAATGGLLDTVVDGVTGLHVPPRDPEAAARALHRLLADPRLAARMGAAGVDRTQSYSWDNIAARVEDVYCEALGTSREAAG